MLPLPLIEWQFVAKMESWATTGQFTQMFFLCFNLSIKNVGEGITILIPIIICYIGQKQTNSYKNNNLFHLSIQGNHLLLRSPGGCKCWCYVPVK